MAIERTLSIIKPDATSRNIIGKIISRFEANNLKDVADYGKFRRIILDIVNSKHLLN